MINPGGRGNILLTSVEIPPEGRVVYPKGFGMIKVFKTFSKNEDVEYYATDDTKMNSEECDDLSDEE